MSATEGARWAALGTALGERGEPCAFFVRDDDAGWADARLLALLDALQEVRVPIDLAVIPQALTPGLARVLRERIDAAPGRIGVHQHGFAHTNHEPGGRKCEFGAARDAAAWARDLIEGRERLRDAFAARLDPIFTPPWNRCAAGLPPLLATLGFAALSRDATAPRQDALPELAVQVDWCRLWREAVGNASAAAALVDDALADAVRSGAGAVGLMLHHAAMNDDEVALLGQLMRWLGDQPRAACVSMRECLARSLAAAPA